MPDIPGSTATTRSIQVGGSLVDTIELRGDHDWIRINLTAGQSYRFDLTQATDTPLTFGDLALRSSGGLLLDQDFTFDDGMASLIFDATISGTYYLDVGGVSDFFTGGYALRASIAQPLPVLTPAQIANYLTDGYWTDTGAARHAFAGNTITYNVEGLTAAGRELAVNAFATWSAVTGLTFRRTTGTAQIALDDSQPNAFATYVANGGTTTSARVNVGTEWLATYGTGINSYSFQTYIHEIGHALGLGHAGNYNGSAGWRAMPGGDNHFINDSWQATIMSYFDQDQNTSVNASLAFVVGPMMADIAAIQSLYGVPANANAGASVYGFNSNATGYFDFSRFTEGNMVAFTIFDSGGTDRIDASGFSGAQRIDLRAGEFSNIGGEVGNIGIATNTVIEQAYGGAGADTMIGNAAANTLRGNGGADTMDGGNGDDDIYGGAGADRHIGGNGLDYARHDDANWGTLVIDLSSPASSTGVAAGDTYVGIEGIIAGIGNDTIVGDALGNRLLGGAGNDVVKGGAGSDSLDGGAGNDVLYGGGDADQIVGGEGFDYVRYDDANYGNLSIRLDAPRANTGAAAGDTYSGIEAFVAGTGNDMVFGDTIGNRLLGVGGNDTIDGRGGSDHLTGGAGADNFRFSTALGAGNVDTIADFAHGVDHIMLHGSIFAGIGPTLDASEFGSTAAVNRLVIYEAGTGSLYYDAGGSGSGLGPILFATVTPNTVLDIGDFVMV